MNDRYVKKWAVGKTAALPKVLMGEEMSQVDIELEN